MRAEKTYKVRNILAALLILIAGAVLGVTQQALVEIDENHPIKPVDQRLLGYNHEWAGQIPTCAISGAAGYNTNVVEKLAGRLSLPLNRMSGTVSQRIHWKGAIGPYQNRTVQQLTDWYNGKLGLGPIEWIQMILATDPDAHFTWTINLFEDPEDAADLVEFLTGDGQTNPNGGTNWAQVRINYGITNPVPVDVWELGNEMDGTAPMDPLDKDKVGPLFRDSFQNITNYTDLCKPFITAIRAVQPDAIIAAHAMTHSSYPDYYEFFGVPWTEWHRNVLREIGDDIDYLAFHVYYNSLPLSVMESQVNTIANDILSITGSDRIKIYMSEYSWQPKTNDCPLGTTTTWKDSWYTTHALLGCLGTADWMTRMMNSPAIELAAYHAFAGSGWKVIEKAADSNLYTVGSSDLYALLDKTFSDGVGIVPVDVSGIDTDRTKTNCMFTAGALTTPNGVNVILVNRDTNVVREVSLMLQRQYVLSEKYLFTAPDLLSVDTATNRPITVTRTVYPSGEPLGTITLPEKSVLVLNLRTDDRSTDFSTYTTPYTISSNTSSGVAASDHALLSDTSGDGVFTVWGSTGTSGSYSLKILEEGNTPYLNLWTARTSGSPIAQISTTDALGLNDNWSVKTRFSATAGNGSLYFGLYADGIMNAAGGYDYTRLILANTNTSVTALGLSISQTGSATVAYTASDNKLRFWNGSAWVTSGSGSYAATGLDVTGATQYEVGLSSDGTAVNVNLRNAESGQTLFSIDVNVSDLGSNITATNRVRFSAGDIASNSTDGWNMNVYKTSLQIAPVISADLNAYPAPYVISSDTSSGVSTNDQALLLDTSASDEFTVWGSTGLTGSYCLEVSGDNSGDNCLDLSSTRTTGNPVAQVSTTVARSLGDKWAVKSVFSLEELAGVSGYAYLGLYGGDAMTAAGGYELKQISLPNTNTAAVALQLAVNSSGSGYISRTGTNNVLEYWDGSAWSSSSASVLSNLNVTGTTRYGLAFSSDGINLNIGLVEEVGEIPLINLNSPICDLGSNIKSANTIRFSAGDLGNNTTYGWKTGLHRLSVCRPPVVSVDLNSYTAPYVISSNTSSGTSLNDKDILQDSSGGGIFTVWGSTGTSGSYNLEVQGDNDGDNGLVLKTTRVSGNPVGQVSTTEAMDLSGNWSVAARFSATAGSGSLYFGLYADDAMNVSGGYDYTRLILANTNTAAVALGLAVSQTGNAVVVYTGLDNKLRFWNGSAWVTTGSGSYAATGLDVTGGTRYDVTLSTDGAVLNMTLANADNLSSIFSIDLPLAELGDNITILNTARFSAGDIASNSTDGWEAVIHSLSLSTLSEVSDVIFFE